MNLHFILNLIIFFEKQRKKKIFFPLKGKKLFNKNMKGNFF